MTDLVISFYFFYIRVMWVRYKIIVLYCTKAVRQRFNIRWKNNMRQLKYKIMNEYYNM